MTALQMGINRNSVNAFYHRLRVIIYDKLMKELASEIKVGESCLEAVCKSKHWSGAKGKVAIFRLLKRGSKVFALLVPGARLDTTILVITYKTQLKIITHIDS